LQVQQRQLRSHIGIEVIEHQRHDQSVDDNRVEFRGVPEQVRESVCRVATFAALGTPSLSHCIIE
jgi:hypothetical protein